jgi:hypothetical protein
MLVTQGPSCKTDANDIGSHKIIAIDSLVHLILRGFPQPHQPDAAVVPHIVS